MPAIVTNEGDWMVGMGPYFLKMVHNPGGDWNPGWGVVPMYYIYIVSFTKLYIC